MSKTKPLISAEDGKRLAELIERARRQASEDVRRVGEWTQRAIASLR